MKIKLSIIITIILGFASIVCANDISATITDQWQVSREEAIPLLRQKLELGTPEEKEEVLYIFMGSHIVELVPYVIEATLDNTVSPRHGDAGWGNIYHQAATALCQFAYQIDGLTQEERGLKEYSFYDDVGTASERRKKQVHKNWLQWWEKNKKDIEKNLMGEYQQESTQKIKIERETEGQWKAKISSTLLKDLNVDNHPKAITIDENLLGKSISNVVLLDKIYTIFVPYHSLNQSQNFEMSDSQIITLIEKAVLVNPDKLFHKYSLAPWKILTVTLSNGEEITLDIMLGGNFGFISFQDGSKYGFELR